MADTSQLSTTDKIRFAAGKYGVDASLAINVACAESNLDNTSENPTSTASGLYQFLDSSWNNYGLHYWGTLKGRSKLSENDQIDLGVRALASEGTGPWLASEYHGFGGGWANHPYEKGLCS